MKIKNCEICSSSKLTLKYQLPDLLLENDQILTSYDQCSNCGLIFQNPQLPAGKMEEFYPPEYDSYESADLNSIDLNSKITHYGLLKRQKFVTSLRDGGRLLDIGCATGNFLRTMQMSPGWDLHGVEINHYAAKIAQEKYSLNVFNGNLREADYPDNYFDIITLWDVLEHLPHPQEILRQVRRLLKDGGFLVFRIPNGGAWDAKLFGEAWFGLDAPRHYFIFNQGTVKRLLNQVGFRITDLRCNIGSSIAIPMDIRFLLAVRRIPAERRKTIIHTFSHPIVKFLFLPITFIFDQLLMGSFLTVSAEKKELIDD